MQRLGSAVLIIAIGLLGALGFLLFSDELLVARMGTGMLRPIGAPPAAQTAVQFDMPDIPDIPDIPDRGLDASDAVELDPTSGIRVDRAGHDREYKRPTE